MARIRTLTFLPEVFKTPTNSQFLRATLDQLVDQPNTKRIEGYVGSRFGYGLNAKDNYVTEPTKVRTDYQLEPGVVFLKENTSTAQDFISYPGIIDALKLEGSNTLNNNRLFNSEFYSWDPFVDLDKVINFNQYYWLPEGPQAVTVSTDITYYSTDYIVQDSSNGYIISTDANPQGSLNPSITLLRGGTYRFAVNQSSQFWIQGQPGTTGFSPTQPNLQTRNVLGVSNNGAELGIVSFTVPGKTSQSEYNFPGNNIVDVVSNLPFDQVDGALVSQLGGIDGITSLNGLTLMFYNTGVPNEEGYISKFYDTTLYDEAGGTAYVYPGDLTNEINFEGGYYTEVSGTFYQITYEGDPSDPVIRLVYSGSIPTNEKITPRYGNQWIGLNFYRDTGGTISLIPYLSSLLDTLYYQDGTSSNKVGVLKLIDSNATDTINVTDDILGKKTYTSPNGVVFTNGLKVTFDGSIFPVTYQDGEYYVQGVGTAIELVPVSDLIVPELFTSGTYIPYDTLNYDIGNYDSNLYIPVTPDYITIARNAIDKNAWTRSNRWFHIDVIRATATYNSNPALLDTYTTHDNKAKRPIIEFYPNLKLFDSGIVGKSAIDFVDFRSTDALSQVAGQTEYYPDVEVYTSANASITGVTSNIVTTATSSNINNLITCSSTSGFRVNDLVVFTGTVFGGVTASTLYYIRAITSNTTFSIAAVQTGDAIALSAASGSMTVTVTPLSTDITVNPANVTGTFQIGQYVSDSTDLLPNNARITAVEGTSSLTVTVSWTAATFFSGTSIAALVANDTNNDAYALFEGARIVFAADSSLDIRNKIYVVRFSTINEFGVPVITLTEATDGTVLENTMTVVYRGYANQGKDFYFYGGNWLNAQQKLTVNQAPLFDIIDANGVSLGNPDASEGGYIGTSFKGTTLFSYGIGVGVDDNILGFPLKYSSVDNVGDISFDVTLNSESFTYVQGVTPITEKINTGYVYNYSSLTDYTRQLGWQTAVAPSVQYQQFDFKYLAFSGQQIYKCDIAMIDPASSKWPSIQVYVNNVIQSADDYVVQIGSNYTNVVFTVPNTKIDTVVQILLLSDQVSTTAHYEIPTNLNNNPLNADITTANIGDIRGQYQSIFYNSPDTSGSLFGANNYRDLGNLVPYGSEIIQNSASLVLPGTFLRKQNHNLFDALLFNSREYINFKSLLVYTVDNTEYSVYQTPAAMLDDAMDQITSAKTDSNSFFWSDMLPSKAAYISNSYSFANSLDVSIYPLSKIYNFESANYNSVLVYLTRTTDGLTQTIQLVRDVDYTVSTTSPSLSVSLDLLPNDVIQVKEYNQTYGSYVPNTPTKLGLYPSTIPAVVLDSNYVAPTYFIVGHDGSYNKLYGTYNTLAGKLVDFRDQVLFEFEKRVYNNLKISSVVPIQAYEVLPGFFRETDYNFEEMLQIYSSGFLNWVGQNRIDFKTQIFNTNNQFSYNYDNSGTKIDRSAIQQGYWRGLYEYYYDTSTPDTSPWKMLGFTDQPTWWTSRYGAAPYTSDNLVLWNDLAQGINWNNGDPVVIPAAVRSGLLKVLPVDSAGNLVSPFVSIIGNYTNSTFNKDWQVGDGGPAEFSYRRSSTWPFDLMRILALTKPAAFFSLGVDLDNYKYNAEFDQYLVNDRSHLVINDVEIYGSGTAKTSYINWIVDYEKQIGVDATSNITTLLDNLDVRLVYRLAGFSDKDLLKFYVEKGTPNSTNNSLLIPDESYSILLYDNQPFTRIIYSGVVIQITSSGYKVYGNSQTNAYFTILKPLINGNYDTVKVEKASVQIANDYDTTETVIPYGTEFATLQQVGQFLASYGKYLEMQGMKFDQIISGIEITWKQMVAEFLYWSQTGWEVGSITNINPAATLISIDKDSNIVQPLTLRQQNFVLNQNLYPIQSSDLSVVRDGTLFTAEPLSEGDVLSFGAFNISNFEHGIVFDNTTLFNDRIYNLITGLRQNRIILKGTKTAEWDGTVDAQGFILNQDNILEWSKETKYTTGSIVKYKNKYWIAIKIIQAKELFDERDWKQTDYNEIQKGLLPNSSTRSYESTLYYDVNKANLESDADLLSFSLIGYRPRDYLDVADLTDITQINVYKNFIKNKGTLNAASAFKGATLSQGGIDYTLYENWAIKTSEFGGSLNSNFVEFKLSEPDLTGNPSIVSLTAGEYTPGSQQEVPLYSLFNYGRPITSPDVLSTLPASTPTTLFPDAGYANFDDVKISSYYYAGLQTNTTPITQLYVRDYLWIANLLGTWQVYTPIFVCEVLAARNNLNGTVTITFDKPHGLSKYQPVAIINFNASIDNYYIVTEVVDQRSIAINLTLNPSILTVTGQGIAFAFQSQRVATPSDIANLPLLNSEFTNNKVWVDTNSDGGWAVYNKTINYSYKAEIVKAASQSFGSAVAFTPNLGYLVGDADAGKVYRYAYNPLTEEYFLDQTLTGSASFGSVVSYADDIFVIAQSTGSTPCINIYQLITTTQLNELRLFQDPIYLPGVTAIAVSTNKDWIYASNESENIVYVFNKSINTGLYTLVNTISGTALGLTVSGDNFGASVATEYAGTKVIVGSPNKNFNDNIDNWGYTYIFNRTVQNFESQYPSSSGIPVNFTLVWTPTQITSSVVSTSAVTNALTCATLAGVSVTDPIIFTGSVFGGIATEKVYYVSSVNGNSFTLAQNRLSTASQIITGDSLDTITVNSTAGFSVNDIVVFYGNADSSGIVSGTTYYIDSLTTDESGNPAITIKSSLVSAKKTLATATPMLTVVVLANSYPVTTATGSMTYVSQSQQVLASKNGILLDVSEYYVIDDTVSITAPIRAGDILTFSGLNFVMAQELTTNSTPRTGVHFGQSSSTTTYASEVLIGAPFEITNDSQEGAIYRFTNGGAKYGTLIGTSDCVITTPLTILLNGFAVNLLTGNAQSAADSINLAGISNIAAMAVDNKLSIYLINLSLATPSDKLNLTVLSSNALVQLGMVQYTPTQTITSLHEQGKTEFGSKIKFNQGTSFVTSAPTDTRYVGTTFDYTSDNIDNDTVFDNNITQWTDTFRNAGAVYMFDYLPVYNESLINTGKFVYAQSVNALNIDYGAQPMYGHSIDFNNDVVIIGTPDFKPDVTNGQVIVYENLVGTSDWSVYRSSAPIVDINKIQDIQLFSAIENTTLDNLDYIDPLQGKILGSVRQNLDIISNVDPAGYNSPDASNKNALRWGASDVGKLWFDTSTTRFVNYHQNDIVYNSKYWGTVFPGSDVAVYSWITSNVAPVNYNGPGVPYDITSYVVEYVLNSTGALIPLYFFWARNTNIVFTKTGKTLADSTLQLYINSPISTGISYFAPLQSNAFALYNCGENINANDTVLHIGFATGTSNDVPHSSFSLIRSGYADDFLPGLPRSDSTDTPESLYGKMIDSTSGVDESGAVVPDPFLPKAVQYGISARPRQSLFVNRFTALHNYLQYANTVMTLYPITETKQFSFLFKKGIVNPSTVDNPEWTSSPELFYDTQSYWEYINWWDIGYNDNTKSAVQVTTYSDLATLSVAVGTIATVVTNANGNSETYILDDTGIWKRIGLQNGTIKFSSALWDYPAARLGFGDNFFDTTPYDDYPSEETRYIIRALNEQIYTNELLIHRNKSLVLLFEFIQSETTESQNYLPWLNKTSFVDVSHTIRELLPIQVFQSDNQDFLAGYLNEVKPYHVVIKEFIFKYTGTDVYQSNITDFDLPSQYNTAIEQFVTPELVYTNPSGDNQYLASNPIWNTALYTQWFNNYGLGITGSDNYPITVLASYIALNSLSFIVDNAFGFPINGEVTIEGEIIGYSFVDTSTNTLSGLTRGVNGTAVNTHKPGAQIFINLPAVLVLDGGRAYTEPPNVTAYLDMDKYPELVLAAENGSFVPAVLVPVMNLDSILSVTVLNPGKGYPALPEIRIDPSVVISFDATSVNISSSTIDLATPLVQTGDLIRYTLGAGTVQPDGLAVDQWYYVGVLQTEPVCTIALYTNYRDAVLDTRRVVLTSTGSGSYNNLNLGARASTISSSLPVRENQISLRFDRTTYGSNIADWQPGSFYSSFYAGLYSNSESISSSSITLQSSEPDINLILSSAHGAAFVINTVTGFNVSYWSSFVRIVGSTEASNNSVRLIPLDGNNPDLSELETNASGSTTGFYIGMPIKFVGAVVGGLVNEQVYYVRSVINQIDFSLEDDNGDLVLLSDATVGSAGLECYVGQTTNKTIVTLDYPGILTATATAKDTNKITVPVTMLGYGGTTAFYVGLPVFFTGAVFGGIIENTTYYVSTIADNQTFTMSLLNEQTVLSVTDTTAVSNAITCNSTIGISVNDPVIFNQMTIGGTSVTDFGNIISGTTYYVSAIISNTTFSIATLINGGVFVLTTASGTASATNQNNTVKLTTDSGAMTLNQGIPVSPGQINGQLFTFYKSLSQTIPAAGTNGNLVTRDIVSSLASTNALAITNESGGLSNLFANTPVVFSSNYGGLVAGTTYYIVSSGTISTAVTSTSSSTNILSCGSTVGFYIGMEVIFGNMSLGGLELDVRGYYVKTIPNSFEFTISELPGGPTVILTQNNGLMSCTGTGYISVSDTVGGTALTLTTDTSSTVMTQTPTFAAAFEVGYVLGGYRAIITNAGGGFAVTNTITVPGASLGGSTPANNLILTVSSVNSMGEILSVICAGAPAGTIDQYYLKVISPNQCEVYSDPLMEIPVNSADFDYQGIQFTTAGSIDSSSVITVDSTSMFNVNDAVVFTGEVFGGLLVGKTYYIVDNFYFTSTTMQVSETLGGMPAGYAESGTCTVATAGDITFLPEPFYFDQSIVKYNNQLYQCVKSNNDDEFIYGKWLLLDSGNRQLNALDRIVGYYQPTVNMPGDDLTQLVSGITYPNSTYLGNSFAPADEYPIDTLLADQKFYPTDVDTKAILWDGTSYVGVAETINYSAVVNSMNGVNWGIDKLSGQPIKVTDITYSGEIINVSTQEGNILTTEDNLLIATESSVTTTSSSARYVITTNSRATPLMVSSDGISWSTTGAYTPYGSTAFDEVQYDITALSIAAISLNSVISLNDVFVAVGENIVRSEDTYLWTQTYSFTNGLTNVLKGVGKVSIPYFTGYVAVGKGQELVSGNAVDTNLLLTSPDGITWTPAVSLTSYGLNTVVSSADTILVAGDNKTRFISTNGANWTDVSGSGYNINDVTYGNDLFVAVGDSGLIETSVDGVTWVVRTSGTGNKLNGITYNVSVNEFMVVGDNNTILSSSDCITWTPTSVFESQESIYTVQGDTFLAGYGPEELVAGVVSDNLTMIVTTRPGTNWDATQYDHVGYNVVSTEITPTVDQVIFSFADIVNIPAQISVFRIDISSGLSTTLYENIDYSVSSWLTKTIELNSPLASGDKLRIDVYEVGNGNQLVKSNSQSDPIELDTVTGFSEISLHCAYSATVTNGSGVIRPGSEPINVVAMETEYGTNAIRCDSVKDFTVNGIITFSGDVFGNIVADTVYYVKSVSTITNQITISETLVLGVAGPTFVLVSDVGDMNVIIQVGNGEVWSHPVVYHNGAKLVFGTISKVTTTNSATNSITCNTTGGMSVNDQVVFSNTIFGDVIVPMQKYYVKTIIDANEFTISDSIGGSTVVLTDAAGGAILITNDYAFDLASNGFSAQMIFAETYTHENDYLVYSVFSETLPEQFGYTIPDVQLITDIDGSTNTFELTNYVGGSNPTNAIVELNGVRLSDTEYTISSVLDTITLVSAPATTDVVAVTSYNLTERQYLHTDYDITGNTVSNIVTISTIIADPLAQTEVYSTDSGTNLITCASTSGFILTQTIQFKVASGSGFGNLSTTGTVYFIKSIDSPTTFTVSETISGTTFAVTTDSGIMIGVVGGNPTTRITTGIDHNLVDNDLVRVNGIVGSTQLNNNVYYAKKISATQVDLYFEPYDAAYLAVNYPVVGIATYTSGGYIWIDDTYTLQTVQVTSSSSGTNLLTCASTAELVYNTPIIFTGNTFGGIVAGTTYNVGEIYSSTEFKLLASHNGIIVSLSSGSGSMTGTQWEQDDVNRLWVTVNGLRVPSSSLRLNANNSVSILHQIIPADVVTITSMVPCATPDEMTYIQNVNKSNEASVYRADNNTRTWLVESLYDTSSVIYVGDVSRVTDTIIQNVLAPESVDGVTSIVLNVDKRIISNIEVFNNTTSQLVSPSYYSVVIVNLVPVLKITSDVSTGDNLIITTTEGNLVYINGEQIKFTTVDVVNNTLGGLTRGINGTGEQKVIPKYSEVYGFLASNRLPQFEYYNTWNSNVYNIVEGDPLQISTTVPAVFLNSEGS